MSCFHPLRAWKTGSSSTGKAVLSFNKGGGPSGEVLLPCGQCVGCRLERARQWAVRCMHEAELYSQNCFITLTYDEAHLPKSGSLDVAEWQRFMKRLRKHVGGGVRFYHCGEYGEQFGRPHYHALLFGYDFSDKVLLKEVGGVKLFTSETLSKLWGKGFATCGAVTMESAAYVARYVMKKITGEAAAEHYGGRKPEYTTMSRRPGVGRAWFEKFSGDVFPSDEVIVNGRSCKPPRYYDNLLEKAMPEMLEAVKRERVKEGNKLVPVVVDEKWDGKGFVRGVVLLPKSDGRLLADREEVKLGAMRSLKRSVE